MKKIMTRNSKEEITAWLLLTPLFILLIVFMYYPPLLGMIRSFFKWQLGKKPEFLGLQNYLEYFRNPYTKVEIINMGTLLLAGLVTGVVFPLLMALLLNGLKSKVAGNIYRRLVMLPMVAPGLVVVMIWKYLYDPSLGPINTVLEWIGLNNLSLNWLGDHRTVIGAIIFIGFPWISQLGTFIFLGGILQLPPSYFEAARMEGASSLRITFSIIIPLLYRQFRLQMTLVSIAAITSFNSILVMTNGGPGFASMVPGLSMYKRAFIYNQFGMSSAIGVILFIVALTITFLISKITEGGEE